MLRKSDGNNESAGSSKSGVVDRKRKLPEVQIAEEQGTDGGESHLVHNVNSNSESKIRRKLTAQELRCKLEVVREKIETKQETGNQNTEGPVQGRADVGKKLALLINNIPGEGPGIWRLGLDLLGSNKDIPHTLWGRAMIPSKSIRNSTHFAQ